MTEMSSPFHPGECAVQQRAGVREKVEAFGRRGIRDIMPEQHRQFFAQLPFFLVGAADAAGRPWAAALFGAPGFVESPEPKLLHVAAVPSAGDPLDEALRDGVRIGCLGIELHTRRRNRVNGKVTLDIDRKGFALRVEQSFGNCPQYIQARQYRSRTIVESHEGSPRVRNLIQLDTATRSIVAGTDTFFIASRYGDDPDDPRHGIDLSHRGGRPGFVQIVDDQTLLWPDYRGNFFFNTLGNLALDPRCGLLLLDFDTGDTLQLTGRAEILWDWQRDDPAFRGAERLVQFTIDHGVHVADAAPFAWDFLGAAPQFAERG
jgi:predicted pyridoxine 5'-phosphate oxidase superfamily flavin-nucleotide-binding protein